MHGRPLRVAAVPVALRAGDTENRADAKDDDMLKWIASRFLPTEHADGALGSIKAIGPLIARVDTEPPERAVKTIANHLENMSRRVLATPSGCRAFRQLDEYAQRPVTGLWDLLLADNLGQTVSDTAWGTLTHYYRTVGSGYRHCLENYGAPAASSERDHADAMLIACRAMMALAKHTLLLHVRYYRAGQDIWSHISSLIDWVERRGNATAQVLPYADTALDTSVERELLTALLIEVAPTANLLPGQIYALDLLLRLYVSYYRFSESYDEQARPFAFEPASNAPPKRWLKGMKERPGVRFFGVGAAYVELCNARDQANAARSLPEWIGSIRCSAENFRELLDRLIAHWSLQPPQRRQRRDACAGEILVAHDWGEIRSLVKFSELARSGESFTYKSTDVYRINTAVQSRASETLRDPRSENPVDPQEALLNLSSFEQSLDPDATELWTLNDSSEAGLGATAESIPPWVRVGVVVAFRHSDSVDWQIAMVRRLNCAADGRVTIGMTRINSAVRSARLRLGTGATDRRTSSADPTIVYDALMLGEGVSTLLLPIGVFDQAWKYTLSWQNRTSTVKMERSLERGLNFERVEVAPLEAVRAA
jgi:hypothetical protein